MEHEMTTETLTLTDFLLARVAEDEAVARGATDGKWEWLPADMADVESLLQLGPDGSCVACFYGMDHIKSHPPHQADADHIARFDPDRVLAECEAKRALIDRSSPQFLLCTLATVYADHPDYREEWRA